MAISATVKLRIYNEALRHLGSRTLASLSEEREPRRVLDGIWGDNDQIARYCLEQGEWNFALKTAELSPEATAPDFGFLHAYDRPGDFIRLSWISNDPYGNPPLTDRQYVDQGGQWLSDFDPIYIRYVSNATDFGFDSALWPETFIKYVSAQMAFEACERITNSTQKLGGLDTILRRYKIDARSKDAMGEGAKFMPAGSWVKARLGHFDRDRNG